MANLLNTSITDRQFCFTLRLLTPAAVAGDIARLFPDLTAFLADCQVGTEDINTMCIAVEELLTNLGKVGQNLGNNLQKNEAISVEGIISVTADALTLTFRDNAMEFDPTCYPPPDLNPQAMLAAPVGGLGLYLLSQLFSEASYQRQNNCNASIWRLRRH